MHSHAPVLHCVHAHVQLAWSVRQFVLQLCCIDAAGKFTQPWSFLRVTHNLENGVIGTLLPTSQIGCHVVWKPVGEGCQSHACCLVCTQRRPRPFVLDVVDAAYERCRAVGMHIGKVVSKQVDERSQRFVRPSLRWLHAAGQIFSEGESLTRRDTGKVDAPFQPFETIPSTLVTEPCCVTVLCGPPCW